MLSAIKNNLSAFSLSIIVFLSLLLRLHGLDHGVGTHPDERHIVMVADRLSWDNMNPNFFAYGTFPFYLLWAVAQVLGFFYPFLAEYDGLFLVGRSLSAVFGALAVYLTYKLAKKVYSSDNIALIAAAFLAFNLFHTQLSHFYAFDGVLTTVTLAALFFILNISSSKEAKIYDYIFSGIFVGIALASKISALSLLLPFCLAAFLNLREQGKFWSWSLVGKSFLFLFSVLAAFSISEPYAWIEFNKFISDNREQITMVQGQWRPPYTVQYAETLPYIYHLEQIAKYTVGFPLTVLGIAGLLSVLPVFGVKLNRKELILAAWLLAVFIIVARYQVKFPRYLLPLYPIFFIFAAKFLTEIPRVLEVEKANRVILCLSTILIAHSTMRTLALASVYNSDHIYKTSSLWIYDNIPAGSKLLQGHWDDTLPLHLPGLDPRRYQSEGRAHELPLYEPESPEKLNMVAERTANTDYIIFPTVRLTGSLTRLPEEFKESNYYIKLLYSGKLGFSLIKTFKVYPEFLGYRLDTDLADESISVYDHPKVTIFKNTERLSAEEIKNRILAPDSFKPLPGREDILTFNSIGTEAK